MHKLKGINSDHNTCEVCHKTNLKKVMWLKEIKINELARQQVNAKIREIMAQFKEVVKRQFDGFRICTNYIKQNYSDYIMG